MTSLNRREFLSRAALAASAASLVSRTAKAAPSERVNVCVIGVRGRGMSVGKGFAGLPEAQVTHVCDVNETLLDGYAKQISDIQKSVPKQVQDLRRVLDDKSVDAIVVTTPDTGTRSPRFGDVRRASMSMSRNRSPTTSLKAVKWWRRHVISNESCRSVPRVAVLLITSRR